MGKLHSPGSDSAIKEGCICPVTDNGCGRGYMGLDGVFIYNESCKYHCDNIKIPNDKFTPPSDEKIPVKF